MGQNTTEAGLCMAEAGASRGCMTRQQLWVGCCCMLVGCAGMQVLCMAAAGSQELLVHEAGGAGEAGSTPASCRAWRHVWATKNVWCAERSSWCWKLSRKGQFVLKTEHTKQGTSKTEAETECTAAVAV